MASFLDVCRFLPTAGGTTDWTVSSAVVGYQTPANAGVVDGAIYRYRAESADLIQWEVGYGIYTVSGAILARTTILFNSVGTTAKINFSTTPQVAIIALAEDLFPIFDAPAYNGIQINGSVDISQENSTNLITITSNVATKGDGFTSSYLHGANTAVIKVQQVAPPGSPSFGLAFPNCLQLSSPTALSSPAASDFAYNYQVIEGYRWARLGFGSTNAQPVTVSFWIYATITGTSTISLRNSSATRSYLKNFTINNATTWEYKTITIPAETTGTWLTTTGVGAYFGIAAVIGSTLQGTDAIWNTNNVLGTSDTTNFFSSNGNVMALTGLLILPGTEAPSAVRSPFVIRPYDQELLLCQRYFRKSFPQATACAQNAGVAGAISVKNPIALGDPSEYVPFSPTMRVAPTITTFNPSVANANWRDITAAADVTVSVDPDSTLSDGGVLLATSGTVATLGDILAIHYKADARF